MLHLQWKTACDMYEIFKNYTLRYVFLCVGVCTHMCMRSTYICDSDACEGQKTALGIIPQAGLRFCVGVLRWVSYWPITRRLDLLVSEHQRSLPPQSRN